MVRLRCMKTCRFHVPYSRRSVLRKYGNMSSATLVFVFDEIMRDAARYKPGQWVPTLAFGPGLNVEAVVLRVPE